MWPFSRTAKVPPRPKTWLTPEQAREVRKIFYADHDANCWYACARLDADGIRLAVSSKEEAIAAARELSEEVFALTGRRLPVEEGP